MENSGSMLNNEGEGPTKVQLPPSHPALLLEEDRGLHFDVGNLVAFAPQPIDLALVREKGLSFFLREDGRDSAQLLFNEILKVPTVRTREGEVLGSLPNPTTPIPREKHIPIPRPPTRWEKFAAIKGIQKKKKSKLVFDEVEQTWKRRHGYDRAGDLKQQWVVEVKPGDPDAYEDPFKKLKNQKKERANKQKKQELRNRVEASQGGGGGGGSSSNSASRPNPKDLAEQIYLVNKSTASKGKFNELLKGESKDQREKGRRKFDPVVSSNNNNKKKSGSGGGSSNNKNAEKEMGLNVLNRLLGKEEQVLDTTRAANLQIQADQRQGKANNNNNNDDDGGGKTGSKRKGKGGFKKSRPTKKRK